MTKFEYIVAELDVRCLVDELNKLGAKGWEVATQDTITSTLVRIILKRPQVAGTIQLLG